MRFVGEADQGIASTTLHLSLASLRVNLLSCAGTSLSTGSSDATPLDVNPVCDYNGTQIQGRRRCVRFLW